MPKTLRGWTCERPGKWMSPCGLYVCYCCMAGLWCEQWEVYKANDEGTMDKMIDYGLTFKEAIADYKVWDSASF